MSSINIIFNRIGKSDPVTIALSAIVERGGFNVDIQFWSQYSSLIMIGVMIVVSIRGVVLFLAQTMGMYFLATILLMRMNLPVKYRSICVDAKVKELVLICVA